MIKSAGKAVLQRAFGRGFGGKLRDLIEGAKVVSFDVFDTLVIRDCPEPSAVFEIVERRYNRLHPDAPLRGFKRIRMKAEADARKAAPSGEPTIYEIYALLGHGFEDIAADLLAFELDTEYRICRANPEVKEIYDYAIASGKRVVIASDMYLDEVSMRSILENCGYAGFERVYVSSELGMSKRNGNTFSFILSDTGADACDVVHIGDHPLADWLVPRRCGLSSYLYARDVASSHLLENSHSHSWVANADYEHTVGRGAADTRAASELGWGAWRLDSRRSPLCDRVAAKPAAGVLPNDGARRRVLDKGIALVSKLKNNDLLRLLTVPTMQARYSLGDLAYSRSSDSGRIAALRGTHAGERCFIVGNGPSLRPEDLESLSGEFCFGSNRVYLLFDQTRWRPTVYLAMDRDFLANEAQRISALPINSKFINRTGFTAGMAHAPDVTMINAHAHHYTLKRFSNNKVAYSHRPDLVIYDGFTVTYVAMQLALWMGFSEIYLIGMDHTFTHEVTPEGIITLNDGVKNHAYEDPEGVVVNPQPKQGVEYAYRIARYEAERCKASIYNATRGGQLEVFERVDLDDLLASVESENQRS